MPAVFQVRKLQQQTNVEMSLICGNHVCVRARMLVIVNVHASMCVSVYVRGCE